MKTISMVLGGILLALAPIIVLAATVYTLLLPNIYASSARISVTEDAPEINPFSDQQQYSTYNPYFLRTQFEIIQSNPILYEVVYRLNLQEQWGRDGEALPRQVALKILRNSIAVFQQRDTSLIVISVKRDNPEEAADIANELAETYRDSRLDSAQSDAHRKIDLMDDAVTEQRLRMEGAEEKVQRIREELDISVLNGEEFGDGIDGVGIQRLEADRLRAQEEMFEKEAILKDLPKVLEELDDGTVMSRSFITSDPIFISKIQELQDVEVQLVGSMNETHDANHPEVKRLMLQKQKLEEELDARLKALRNGLQTEYAIAENYFEALDKVLAKIRSTTLEVQSEKYRPFREAQNDLETERFIYNQLKEKQRLEIITLQVPRNPVEIIDVAEPNRRPVSPNLFMNIIISVVIAGMFGLTGAVLLMLGLKKSPPPIP